MAKRTDHAIRNKEVASEYSTPVTLSSNEAIGARMRGFRHEAGLSQASLARRMGLSAATISQWEHGYTGGSRKHLPAIAEALNTSLAHLLSGAGPKDSIGEDVHPVTPISVSPSRDIGARIRLLRQLAGLSQEDLARKTGVSTPAIGFWETGRPGDAQKHLPTIAQALGVGVEVLLDGNCHIAAVEQLSGDEQIVLYLYRRLDAVGKINAQRWLEKRI